MHEQLLHFPVLRCTPPTCFFLITLIITHFVSLLPIRPSHLILFHNPVYHFTISQISPSITPVCHARLRSHLFDKFRTQSAGIRLPQTPDSFQRPTPTFFRFLMPTHRLFLEILLFTFRYSSPAPPLRKTSSPVF